MNYDNMNFRDFASLVESLHPSKAGVINRISPDELCPNSPFATFFSRVAKDQLLDNDTWDKFKSYQPVLSGVILMNSPRAQAYAYLAPAIGPLLKEPGSCAVSIYEGIPKEYQQSVMQQRVGCLLGIAHTQQGLNLLSGQGRVSLQNGSVNFYSAVMHNPSLTWVIPAMTQDPQLKKLIPQNKLYEFAEMYPALKGDLKLTKLEQVKMTMMEQNPLNPAVRFGSQIPSKDTHGLALEAIER